MEMQILSYCAGLCSTQMFSQRYSLSRQPHSETCHHKVPGSAYKLAIDYDTCKTQHKRPV